MGLVKQVNNEKWAGARLHNPDRPRDWANSTLLFRYCECEPTRNTIYVMVHVIFQARRHRAFLVAHLGPHAAAAGGARRAATPARPDAGPLPLLRGPHHAESLLVEEGEVSSIGEVSEKCRQS